MLVCAMAAKAQVSDLPKGIEHTCRISSPPPPAAIAGVPYSFIVKATSTSGALRFTALGLPAGLTIDPVTGDIAGTTVATGSYAVAILVSGCRRNMLQTFTFVVAAALLLSSQPNPAIFGQAIAVLAHVVGDAVVPTGSVLLCALAPGQVCPPPVGAPPPGTDPSLIPPLLTAPLNSAGDAAFTLTGLAIQQYVLQAYYGGDANHGPGLSAPVDQFVIKGTVFPPRVSSASAMYLAAPVPARSETALALLVRGVADSNAWRSGRPVY